MVLSTEDDIFIKIWGENEYGAIGCQKIYFYKVICQFLLFWFIIYVSIVSDKTDKSAELYPVMVGSSFYRYTVYVTFMLLQNDNKISFEGKT